MQISNITIKNDQAIPFLKKIRETKNSVIEEKPYFRSRLYTTDTGNNRLIAASAPLFTLLSKLSEKEFTGNTSELHQFLAHEIHAFETQARSSHYQPETILAARYVIAAAVDEAIMNTHWGIKHGWHTYKLLYSFQKVEDQGNRVFAILDRITEMPETYIDLMELIYLCFSFNFKGKHRNELNGDLKVNKISDELYHKIRQHRNTPKRKLANYKDKLITQKKNSFAFITPRSIWMTATTLLFLTLFGFDYLLTINRAPLIEELRAIQIK